MTVPVEIREAAELERRRCIGVMLSEYGIWKMAGEERIAAVLDALATKLEHPEFSAENYVSWGVGPHAAK